MVTLTLNLIYGFLKSAKLVEMTISLCTLQTIIMIFSTFLRFLRLPIRSRVRRPKLWVSTGFKSSSQKCQNMNCGGLKKTLEAFFYSFQVQVHFKSVLNAAFLTLHFNSLIFGPHEKIGNFEIDPKPKIALCGGSVVKLALHFFLAANTIGRHQHKSAAPVHKIPISQWSMFFLFHCCQKPASLICEMVCNTNL